MKIVSKIIAIIAITSISLFAMTTPNIGTVEKEIKAPHIEKTHPELPDVRAKEFKSPMIDNGEMILIEDFMISGNEHISTSELEQFFVSYRGQELSFNQIQQIASDITTYYREQGYIVSRAYIPTQNILKNNYTLEIKVIEGMYDKFFINNKSFIKNSILQDIVDDTKETDKVISSDTLERTMLLINDRAGAVVSQADIKPGDSVGTSNFVISVAPTKRYDGYILTDNEGGRYTSRYRGMAGLNINSPFLYGDKISLSGLISQGSNLKNGRVAYTFPILSNGLTGEISYAKTDYSLIKLDNIVDHDYEGNSETIEGKLSYPIIRARTQNLYSSLVLDKKELVDTYQDSTLNNKDIKSLSLGLDYDKKYLVLNKSFSSTASLFVTYGNLENGNIDENYEKINLDLTNVIDIDSRLSFESKLSLQHALGNKNLDGSEDFSIGGSSGVKVYPSGESSAENGYLFNFETKYKFQNNNEVSNTIGIFYDIGRVYMEDSSTDAEFESRVLQDAGIGYYASYKNFFGKLQVAWNVGNKPVTSEPDRNSRILYQLGMTF